MSNWGFAPVDTGYFIARKPILGIRGTGEEARVAFGNHNVYYVDPSNGNSSDNNLGTDPYAPLDTIQQAITYNNATVDWAATPPYQQMNVIAIAPGVYDENLTPPYYCKMIGLGMATGGDICVNVEPTAGSCMAGTGLALYLYNIRWTCNTAVPVLDFGTANSCVIEQNMICDGNPGLATVGIDIETAGGTKILNNSFTFNTNPLTIGIRSTGTFFDCEIKGNRIAAVTTGIDLSTGGLFGGTLIKSNAISGGGAVLLATGIDDSVTGDTLCVDNFITATDAIDHADVDMCIANHVINAGAGAVELTGTD